MNEQIVKMLKDQIRKLEADLSNWGIVLFKAQDAAAEAESMCAMLQEQLSLVEGQLKKVSK